MSDWYTVGIHGGYRRAEWCQEHGHNKVDNEEVSPKDESQPLAFTLNNFTFLGQKRRQLPLHVALKNLASILQVKLHHKWQKKETTVKKKL